MKIIKVVDIITIFFFCLFTTNSNAALPFVTDDAFIQNPNQLAIETFTERWSEPKQVEAGKNKTTIHSYFLSASYGLTKHIEMSLSGNIGYDLKDNSSSYANPTFQLKTKIFESKKSGIPSMAIDWGYVNRNGKGEYFDPATNYYAIAAFTTSFFDDDLITHLNIGKKASFGIPNSHLYRTHLGVGVDFALDKKIRGIVESYNGSPNSPRDSPDYFRSYQVGLRWLKSDHLSLYTLYGSQPTYSGNSLNDRMLYRRTSWVQIGARIIIDKLF